VTVCRREPACVGGHRVLHATRPSLLEACRVVLREVDR
jgi:hypothetical protein